MKNHAIQTIRATFQARGNEQYASEKVTQLQHALQCAALAERAEASAALVAASLLHDIGHIMSQYALPASLHENLDDRHEERAYQWLKDHFGESVAEPVRLHVAAKRYLCSKDPHYTLLLSPTSLKSFEDQGGLMSQTEIAEFEANPYFSDAILLRKWDDTAKDAEKITHDLDYFLCIVEKCAL